MNKNLIISIIVIILAAGAGYWVWSQRDTDDWKKYFENRPPTYTDPATLKPGDQFGVFTVKSATQDENGDWQVQLTGEKVVRGRYVVLGPIDSRVEDGLVCFLLDDAGDEPIAPPLSKYENNSFCVFGITSNEFEATLSQNKRMVNYFKIRIGDPVLRVSEIYPDSATLLEILDASSTPEGLLTP